MDERNEKPNPFSSLEKTSKSSDSRDIFGHTGTSFLTKHTDAETAETSSNIFAKRDESPPSTVPVTSEISSSVPSQNRSIVMSPDPLKKDKKEPPVRITVGNVFESELSSTSSSASSSPRESSIFGRKMGRNDSQDTSPFALAPQNVLPSTTTTEYESIFGKERSSSIPFVFKSSPTSTLANQFGAPAPVFSSQSKQSKVLKGPYSASLFGGKTPARILTHKLGFGAQNVPSRENLRKESVMFGRGDTSVKSGLAKPQNPSLVFNLKSAKKKDEAGQTNVRIFTSPSKLRSELSPESAALSKFPSSEKKVELNPCESSNIFFNTTQDKDTEGSYVFQTDSKSPPAEVKCLPKESTMLIAVDIPPNYFDKSILENHFMKFGPIKKIFLYKKSKQASITFKTHEAAAEAKAKGKKLHPRIPEMKLFFGAPHQSKKGTEPSTKASQSEKKPPVKLKEIFIKPLTSGIPIEKAKSSGSLKKNEFKNKAPTGNLGSIKDSSVLIKSQAKNNYDKYLILDARDKVLRAKQKKVVDVNKAQYLLATCPDMCPEKERYSRDIQYDVSNYEMTDGEIDHRLAVKKFSRSSADKDEPLPHELRPGPVLQRTVDFLICNVMNKVDEDNVQIDLWFNYLFNRTRALRNDIMQQHLVDHNAIYVLERCTRFHIHCSHNLCEEPADYFDAKINAEHLTKSLQSLKELYHDLGEKGIYFESEPEFRAYEILLNITDGNVIFKYLKFRSSVRNSTEVQFSVKVLHSLHTNNYVQFFRLVGKATYLQACIMHKYFTNVRRDAFNVIAKAYKSQQLPATKFMEMLEISNETEFQKLTEYFGISLNEDSKFVCNKTNFPPKSETPPLTRSLYILTVKTQSSTGEMIQNGPLPVNPFASYQPHDSFDSTGYLEQNALDASDQNSTPDWQQQLPLPEIEVISRDDFENESLQKELYSKVEEMDRIKLLRRCYNAWTCFVRLQKEKRKREENLKILILRKFTKLWKQKVAKTAELNRKVDEHLQRKYFQKWKVLTRSALQRKEDIRNAKLVEERIISRKLLKTWQTKASCKKSVRVAKSARGYLLARKFFTKWRSYTEAMRLERKTEAFYVTKVLKSSFTHWKNWCIIKRKKSKIDFESFPAVGSQLSPEALNKLLDWGYDRDDRFNMSAYEISELDRDINTKSRQQFSLQQLAGIVAWTALPLLQRFQADVSSKPPDFSGNMFSRCFKILIMTCSGTNPYFCEWIRTKFDILETEDISIPLQSHSQFISRRNEVTYTVIVSEKELIFGSEVDLVGASVVILIGNEDKLELMSRFVADMSDIPYLVLCKSQNEENIDKNIWLLTKEAIDSPFTSEKLFNFVFNLWQRRDVGRNLQIGKCSVLADKFISEKVLAPIYHAVIQRKLYDKPTVCPSKVVEFYNAAISHIYACIQEFKLRGQLWLPSEAMSHPLQLCQPWNHSDVISVAFQKAFLPPFNLPAKSASFSVRNQLAKYLENVASKEDWSDDLFSKVERIIKETERNFESGDQISVVAESCELYHQIPWLDILSCCIFFKLSLLPSVDVAYKQSDIESFDKEKQWISSLNASELQTFASKNDIKPKRKVPLIEMYSEPKKRKTTHSQFLADIEEEKKKSLALEDELKSQMLVEEELKLLFPDYDEALAKLS